VPDLSHISFVNAKVAVIGDMIHDEYLHCTSTRVSPEAPVPVCKLVLREQRAGGAGNVRNGIMALGGKVSFVCAPAPLHIKTRVVVGHHQVARIDQEPDPVVYLEAWRIAKGDILSALRKANVCTPAPAVVTPADVRALRESNGISQAVLAMYLGTSTAAVTQWELGLRTPTGATAKLLDLVRRKGLKILL
jgi:DNA-binding transcriptional regulator YiaG